MRLGARAARGDEAALAELLDATRAREPVRRAAAVRGLSGVADERADSAIWLALDDRSVDVRLAAVDGAITLYEYEPLDSLLIPFSDERVVVREAAAEALGELADPLGMFPLIEGLDDRAPCVRVACASSLGRMGALDAISPLREALRRQRSPIARLAYRAALWQLGLAEYREGVVRALKHDIPEVRTAARSVLARLHRRTG